VQYPGLSGPQRGDASQAGQITRDSTPSALLSDTVRRRPSGYGGQARISSKVQPALRSYEGTKQGAASDALRPGWTDAFLAGSACLPARVRGQAGGGLPDPRHVCLARAMHGRIPRERDGVAVLTVSPSFLSNQEPGTKNAESRQQLYLGGAFLRLLTCHRAFCIISTMKAVLPAWFQREPRITEVHYWAGYE
jgi:hypothetical protein